MKLLSKRDPYYRRINYHVKSDEKSVREISRQIIDLYELE